MYAVVVDNPSDFDDPEIVVFHNWQDAERLRVSLIQQYGTTDVTNVTIHVVPVTTEQSLREMLNDYLGR